MRVVIAMDSFKGSLSSIEAGKAVAEGVRRADGAIECVVCPVADGGEGTSAALTEGLHGETVRVRDFLRIGVPFTLAAVLTGYVYIWLVWGI